MFEDDRLCPNCQKKMRTGVIPERASELWDCRNCGWCAIRTYKPDVPQEEEVWGINTSPQIRVKEIEQHTEQGYSWVFGPIESDLARPQTP